MYPLSMFHAGLAGFAVANDETEHRTLTAGGYTPPFVEEAIDPNDDPSQESVDELTALRAQAAERGIKVPGNWGVKRLSAELAK